MEEVKQVSCWVTFLGLMCWIKVVLPLLSSPMTRIRACFLENPKASAIRSNNPIRPIDQSFSLEDQDGRFPSRTTFFIPWNITPWNGPRLFHGILFHHVLTVDEV